MLGTIRGWVSQRKRRFKEDGYNLDLSYIIDHIIAMGFPAKGFTGMYRNPMAKVQQFLRERHGESGYCVYNLCSEDRYAYKPHKFETVANFPFDDHQVPSLDQIRAFCQHVDKFLGENLDGVAAIHCKAGQGRTGVMISCYLLHSGVCKSPSEALAFYARRRTHDDKGITVASQERYVGYFGEALRKWPEQRCVLLRAASIDGLGWLSGSSGALLVICCRPTGQDTTMKVTVLHINNARADLSDPIQLEGDVRLKVARLGIGRKPGVLFSAWLHTSFLPLEELVLTGRQLDKVAKMVPNGVSLRLSFSAAQPLEGP